METIPVSLLRADGGTDTNGTTHDEVLATVKSASIRTYHSPDAVPEPISVNKQIATPSDVGLDFEIAVVTQTATSHTPARVSITVEYLGEEPATFLGCWRHVPNLNGSDGLHLYPAQYPIEREDTDCWNVEPLATGFSVAPMTLQPKEVREEKFDIVGDTNTKERYPQGEYKLIQRYQLPDRDTEIVWGVDIKLV